MLRTISLIAPYAAWMVMMSILPRTASAYAVRGLITAALLLAVWCVRSIRPGNVRILRTIGWGLTVGLIVFLVWIIPGPLIAPAAADAEATSPYAPSVCGWTLTLAKLFASAFIISVAEELFFRKWLVEFAGFGWMLVLFGVEHMRWDLGVALGCVYIAEGVFAGFAYGYLAKRCGLLSAIIAHAFTNLILGLYVIAGDKWYYW